MFPVCTQIMILLLLTILIVTLIMPFIILFLLFISVLFLPKYTRQITFLFSRIFLICCRYIGIKYKIYGAEHIQHARLVASNHESMWETVAFMSIFRCPCFLYKAELINMPIVGRALKKLNMIPVYRNAHTSQQKNLIQEINILTQQAIQNNQTIIIFPEGKRVKHNEYKKFKSGIIHIAHNLNLPITAVAINSEFAYGKTIEIHIMPNKFYKTIEDLEKTILDIKHMIP